MKKIIILDFDGTIIDSAPIIKNVLNNLRDRLNLAPLKLDEVQPWISEGGKILISECLLVKDEENEKWLKEFRRIYKDTPTPHHLIYSWVKEFLNYAVNNSYELAICSNKPENLLNSALEDTNIKHFFSAIVGNSKSMPAKPNPDSLCDILERLGYLADHALMIGDSIIDKKTCVNAGVDFIFFEGGYNDGYYPERTNYSFKNFKELKTILEQKLNIVDTSTTRYLMG